MRHISPYKKYKDKKHIESDFLFRDDDISLRITTSPKEDKGKLYFRFKVEIPELPEVKERKVSFVLGCLMLLDTDYEKIPEIRDAVITHNSSRYLQKSTKESLIKELLKKMGFDNIGASHKERKIWNDFFAKSKFERRFQELSNKSKTLGDIFDGIKTIQNEFFEYEKDDYEKWTIENSMKKFNL